jgi:hypothetical protein
MSERHLPVRPNLNQLKHQAKDLLRALHQSDPLAIADLQQHHPENLNPVDAKLADAQLVLAKSYGNASWPRLVLSCRLIDAIWKDDVDVVRELVLKDPRLLHDNARGTERCNWGPPMSYAANLGRDRIIDVLSGLGAEDMQKALDRAILQGRIDAARKLYAMGARPEPGAIMGPAETQSGKGMAFLFELGAEIADDKGDWLAPVGLLLETYCRNPSGKHMCLELLAERGVNLPDTPVFAVHRGRIDLLEAHFRRDPGILNRTYSHRDIYPLELGCHEDETLALSGTPPAGGTLLHLCVDGDEMEIAQWLISQGADANAKSELDSDGFGGHTPLFGCVVSQTYIAGPRKDDAFARLLLDNGADLNARASLRKALRFVEDESMHEYHNVTPLGWGEQFHGREWVNPSVMKLIAERGGHR